jgi:RNA polymerase subunit RPABC4/transcription elongation factor Spt4
VSDIIESIKQSADQVLSSIDQEGRIKSTLQGLRSQWHEVEKRRQISQLKGEIKTLQTETKQLTEALGLQTLSLHEAGRIDHPELARLCERITQLQTEIGEKRAVLADLKEQMASAPVKCPQCQASVAAEAEFCPKCGAQIKSEQSKAAPTTQGVTQAAVRLRCPKCKTVLPQNAGFCPTCGVKLKMPPSLATTKRFCASCGAEMSSGARFCPVCGHAAGT